MIKFGDPKSDANNSSNTTLDHNNSTYKSNQDNRSEQLNPNNDK